jgi:hypothetical protein
MNRTRRTLSVLLVVAVVFAIAPSPLWAVCEVPTPGSIGIPVNPNASGTKLFGTLTIFYNITDICHINGTPSPACACDTQVKTQVFAVLKLQSGNTIATFSDGITTPICFEDSSDQVTLIENLVQSQVLPFFFPGQPGGTFQVKSLTNIVPNAGSPTESVSMDVVLAVR